MRLFTACILSLVMAQPAFAKVGDALDSSFSLPVNEPMMDSDDAFFLDQLYRSSEYAELNVIAMKSLTSFLGQNESKPQKQIQQVQTLIDATVKAYDADARLLTFLDRKTGLIKTHRLSKSAYKKAKRTALRPGQNVTLELFAR